MNNTDVIIEKIESLRREIKIKHESDVKLSNDREKTLNKTLEGIFKITNSHTKDIDKIKIRIAFLAGGIAILGFILSIIKIF